MGKSPRLSKTLSWPGRSASSLEGFKASKAARFVIARTPNRRPLIAALRRSGLDLRAVSVTPPARRLFQAHKLPPLRTPLFSLQWRDSREVIDAAFPFFLSSFVGFLDCMRRLVAAPEAQSSDDKMTRPRGAFRPPWARPRAHPGRVRGALEAAAQDQSGVKGAPIKPAVRQSLEALFLPFGSP